MHEKAQTVEHEKAQKAERKAKDARVANGSSMLDFFNMKRGRGRPQLAAPMPKSRPTGRRPTDRRPTGSKTTDAASEAGSRTMLRARSAPKKRTNWSLPANRARLEAALAQWAAKTDPAASRLFAKKGNGKSSLTAVLREPTMREFADTVGIPQPTFSKYCAEKSTLGVGVGRKILISQENSDLIIDVVRRADRGNNGMGGCKIAEVITKLQPDLTTRQARLSFDRTVRPKARAARLTTGSCVKVQATTTKRSQVSSAQH